MRFRPNQGAWERSLLFYYLCILASHRFDMWEGRERERERKRERERDRKRERERERESGRSEK
jgi:hypothetical protein